MFLLMRFSRTPDADDNASHKSSLPSGDGVACFPQSLPLPHTHTLAPHTVSLAFRLTGEGGIKPEQSAHIGSPELPSYTQPLTTAPTSTTLPPTLPYQTQSHVDAQSHPTYPHSHWRTGGHLPFPEESVVWGDIVTSPLRALHTAGLASPLPASLPSVPTKGLVQEQSPTSREPC